MPPLLQTSIPGFPVHRGKVRDVIDLGEHLLVVATDRLSAFDVVFGDPIPLKGRVLTQLSTWWFRKTHALVPNHFVSAEFSDFPAAMRPFREQLEGRAMLVKKALPLKAEFVVRGYLDGSAWGSYASSGQVCGIELLSGLRRRTSFGAPVFTPTTKAEAGHDLPIDFAAVCHLAGRDVALRARDYAAAVYTYAHNFVFTRGLILSDTKFEFGVLPDGELILIDEVLTPDSSRYWLRETYSPDSSTPVPLDKQFVRDYVESIGWDKQAPAPPLPAEVIKQTTERYLKAFEMVTGEAMA